MILLVRGKVNKAATPTFGSTETYDGPSAYLEKHKTFSVHIIYPRLVGSIVRASYMCLYLF